MFINFFADHFIYLLFWFLWSWGLKSYYMVQASLELELFLPKGLPGEKCQAWLFLQVVSYFIFFGGYNYGEQYFHVKMAT